MCVRIRFAVRSAAPIYDPAAGLITLPDSIAQVHRVTAVKAVLSELRVPQPELGAVCWCGSPSRCSLAYPSSEGASRW